LSTHPYEERGGKVWGTSGEKRGFVQKTAIATSLEKRTRAARGKEKKVCRPRKDVLDLRLQDPTEKSDI